MKRLTKASALLSLSMTLVQPTMATPGWNKLMNDFNLDPQYHGFCFTDSKGEIKGSNPHMKVRLASVSKVITTLWAVDKLSPDFSYQTKFYLKDKHLHIEGSKDPVFSNRKLFFLLSQLNNLGISELDKITFSKDLKVFTNAEYYSGEIIKVSRARTARNLKDYFHTPDWNRLKAAYKEFIKYTPKSIIEKLQIRSSLDDLSLTVKEVAFSDTNPFKDSPDAVQEYNHLSPEIAKYLKVMNVKSNNYIADQVFEKLGGEAEFDKWVQPYTTKHFPNYKSYRKKFSKDEKSIKLFTGSGLNDLRNNSRVDNYATCGIIVRLVEELKNKMDDYNKEIQQIVAVPGVDAGTFRSRLKSPRLAKTMVAKTGTLFHTSTIAGMINGKNSSHYFGVFHQLRGSKSNAKMVQNKIITKMVDDFGGPNKFSYDKQFFFPAKEVLR